MQVLKDTVLESVSGGRHLRTGNIKINQFNFSNVNVSGNKLDFGGGGGDMIIITVTQTNNARKPDTSI